MPPAPCRYFRRLYEWRKGAGGPRTTWHPLLHSLQSRAALSGVLDTQIHLSGAGLSDTAPKGVRITTISGANVDTGSDAGYSRARLSSVSAQAVQAGRLCRPFLLLPPYPLLIIPSGLPACPRSFRHSSHERRARAAPSSPAPISSCARSPVCLLPPWLLRAPVLAQEAAAARDGLARSWRPCSSSGRRSRPSWRCSRPPQERAHTSPRSRRTTPASRRPPARTSPTSRCSPSSGSGAAHTRRRSHTNSSARTALGLTRCVFFFDVRRVAMWGVDLARMRGCSWPPQANAGWVRVSYGTVDRGSFPPRSYLLNILRV